MGTIVGGSRNLITACSECVGGNLHNDGSTIVGGVENKIHIRAHGSTIAGGNNNTVESDMSLTTVGGGAENIVASNYGTIPGGKQARTSNYGQQAYASGQFESVGDAQTSTYVCRGTSTNATLTELFLDGASQRMVVSTDSTWAFDALVTARASDGSSGAYQIRGTIKNINGTTTFAGSPTFNRLGNDDPTWDVIVTADDLNNALVVNVLGKDATSIRWVASVRTVEVTY